MFPLIAALGLSGAKLAVDAYTGTRQARAQRRMQHRQEDNEATQEHDARRAAIMSSLGVDAPLIRHQLKDLGSGADTSGSQTLSGLLGFGANVASLYGAQPQAGPSDVPMPYKNQDFTSIYGPGSRIKPGTPYR